MKKSDESGLEDLALCDKAEREHAFIAEPPVKDESAVQSYLFSQKT